MCVCVLTVSPLLQHVLLTLRSHSTQKQEELLFYPTHHHRGGCRCCDSMRTCCACHTVGATSKSKKERGVGRRNDVSNTIERPAAYAIRSDQSECKQVSNTFLSAFACVNAACSLCVFARSISLCTVRVCFFSLCCFISVLSCWNMLTPQKHNATVRYYAKSSVIDRRERQPWFCQPERNRARRNRSV